MLPVRAKSSLVCHEFVRRNPQAIIIDQKAIGTSIRSTPTTYTGVMDEIRKLFGKENGVAVSWFSYNSKGGCAVCKGTGQITYDMAFAEPVVVPCEECGGHRYNPTALSYTYKGMNIEEVMSLTIEQAMDLFDIKKIRSALQSMIDVGLGYLTLGQPTSTLSGGEVQRVKLASELHKQGRSMSLMNRVWYFMARILKSFLHSCVNSFRTVTRSLSWSIDLNSSHRLTTSSTWDRRAVPTADRSCSAVRRKNC